MEFISCVENVVLISIICVVYSLRLTAQKDTYFLGVLGISS